MDERAAKLQALLEEGKAEEIFVDSVEETQKNLAANGIDFTIEELKELGKALMAEEAEGELDADQLDGVAGGASLWKIVGNWIRRNNPIIRPRWKL